jgi:predicted Zn-dependent peptidase
MSPVDRTRLPDVGPNPPFRFPAIVRHALANGLGLRLVEHRGAPVVTFVLQIEGGAGADPSGKEGLAALTADMADEGTGTLSALDMSDALARIGADYDVDAGADATVFTLTTLVRFAERAASLLAGMVTQPSLREADMARVRQLRLARLRQLEDLPPATAERAFLGLLYGTHPYGHLSIGTGTALRALSPADVAWFHRTAYRPSRATLVVGGALPESEMLRVAEAAFGSWRDPLESGEPALVAAASIDPPAAPAARLAIVPRDGAAQSELRIGHLSARRNTPDYSALLVMNAVVGGQFVSRINLKLREEKGYTYGARTGFDWRRGPAPLVLQASVHTGATVDAIRDSLAELTAIRGSRPPTGAELGLAKASLTRGYPRNFETATQVARSVAQLTLFGLPDRYFEEFVSKIDAVTGDEVTRVAQVHIDPSRIATVVVGDRAAVGESLLELGMGEPLVLSAESDPHER